MTVRNEVSTSVGLGRDAGYQATCERIRGVCSYDVTAGGPSWGNAYLSNRPNVACVMLARPSVRLRGRQLLPKVWQQVRYSAETGSRRLLLAFSLAHGEYLL